MPDADELREVVHDLRNRLSAIVSAANAIHKSDFDRELGEEMIEIIRDNVHQATEVLGAFSRRRSEDNA